MRRRGRCLLLAGLAGLLSLTSNMDLVSAQTLEATVLSIGDGDTLRIRQAGRAVTVRLACIDAPETAQSPWGQQARRYLQQRLALGRQVTLDVKTTDRYGRTVAELLRAGRNVNQALVGSGAAFVYWRYISGCDRTTYSRLESTARLRRLGVWSAPGGLTRPWDYRQAQVLLREGLSAERLPEPPGDHAQHHPRQQGPEQQQGHHDHHG